MQKYYYPGTRCPSSLVQGHFWSSWRNNDFWRNIHLWTRTEPKQDYWSTKTSSVTSFDRQSAGLAFWHLIGSDLQSNCWRLFVYQLSPIQTLPLLFVLFFWSLWRTCLGKAPPGNNNDFTLGLNFHKALLIFLGVTGWSWCLINVTNIFCNIGQFYNNVLTLQAPQNSHQNITWLAQTEIQSKLFTNLKLLIPGPTLRLCWSLWYYNIVVQLN